MEPRNVRSRIELIQLLTDLVNDFSSNDSSWENRDVPTFLEAMASWLEDCEGFYDNVEIPLDVDTPSWQIFADAMAAARIYE